MDGVDLARLREETAGGAATVALDGGTGEVWLEPDEATRRELDACQRAIIGSDVAEGHVFPPLHTRDGRRVELAANVTSAADAGAAVRAGAEAIGLLRTEFLFFDRAEPPTEDEQTEALRAIIAALAPDAPVTVRTFDIGGDKPVALSARAAGSKTRSWVCAVCGLRWRAAICSCVHLRAILRAAHGRRFRIMFPMVTERAEVRRARALLVEAHDQLSRRACDHGWPVEIGMMVEVPAAALNAPALCRKWIFSASAPMI